MRQRIDKILKDFESAAKTAVSVSEVDKLRHAFLGKSGEFSAVMQFLKDVPKEEKPEVGKYVNEARVQVETAIEKLEKTAKEAEKNARLVSEKLDVTLPAESSEGGSIHPLTLMRQEFVDIFTSLGFEVHEGPEIELDYFNFQLMNLPKDHPARDAQDTFYVSDDIILRTHTSPMQARVMLEKKPPIRIIVPGKVYRVDDDASHSPMFQQIEGLVVDKNITLCDLKGTLDLAMKKVFSQNTKIRFRPSFFPFTEPSVEVDCSCPMCGGKGCRLCKGTGWIEILGAGIVNPKVLDACGVDSTVYSGFAFGCGIERMSIIKYGVSDIRYFFENDARFLRQFK